MRTIYKYPLAITDMQQITMPYGATVLTVQVQNGIPCLWAEVSSSAEPEERIFFVYGTGHSIRTAQSLRVYVGTFQLHGGALVFHVFEAIR